MKTQWIYRGELFDDDNLDPSYVGFIYLITHLVTKKKYIGRKLLTIAAQKQKNKIITKYRKDSGWRDYFSSCPEILEIIESEGTENFQREILAFGKTKGMCNYLEEKFQYSLGVLETDEYYNKNIRAKMFKRNILNKLDTQDINTLIGDFMNGTRAPTPDT